MTSRRLNGFPTVDPWLDMVGHDFALFAAPASAITNVSITSGGKFIACDYSFATELHYGQRCNNRADWRCRTLPPCQLVRRVTSIKHFELWAVSLVLKSRMLIRSFEEDFAPELSGVPPPSTPNVWLCRILEGLQIPCSFLSFLL
jgi:hypothetical protein